MCHVGAAGEATLGDALVGGYDTLRGAIGGTGI